MGRWLEVEAIVLRQFRNNILIRLSTVAPLPFLTARALVDENGADCCTAAATRPSGGEDRRAEVSWHTLAIDGRAGLSDMGIRNTLARDASAGDRDRIGGR